MRNLIFGMLLLLPGIRPDEDVQPFPRIETEFPLLWKASIGQASFRTKPVLTEKEILIGSNGSYFLDFAIFDRKSGVYAIDRSTGKIKRHFASERLGDMDVNGLLHYNGKYYFGNDNEEFLCTTTGGKIIWRNIASGDIEHEPSLIKIQGKNHIIYAAESGEVRAVDPSSGNSLWTYYTPDYTGFKKGDNRAIFKVKAHFTNTRSFFTKPLVRDLNRDGTDDLVYLTVDNKVYAISGLNGKLLWLYEPETSMTYDIALIGTADDPLIILTQNRLTPTYERQSYLITLDRHGKQVRESRMIDDDFETSLNHFMTSDGKIVITTPDSVFIAGTDGGLEAFDHGVFFMEENGIFPSGPGYRNRNTGDQLLSKKTFRYDEENPHCIIILNQHDYTDYSKGHIEIFSLDNKKVLKRLSLPSSSEMVPEIMDINNDGYLDLLVNCRDENLYCYNLKIRKN